MVAAAGFLLSGLYFPIGAWTQPFHAGLEPQEGKILAQSSHELVHRRDAYDLRKRRSYVVVR